MPPKSHRKKQSGRKADKRKQAVSKKKNSSDAQARKQNPKAFAFSSPGKLRTQAARSAEKEQRRMHVPMSERATSEPPPIVVLVHGPPGVGKTSIIRGLAKHWTRQDVRQVRGPVTLVAGKQRRVTLVEAPPDLAGQMDAAKYADLVLLVVDGAFGFEMETFEFLNLLQVAGFPKVMGVLTHLDGFTDVSSQRAAKKALKQRFWTEVYDGAKLFYLSGQRHGKYLKREMQNLARFIGIQKLRPLAWRIAHPYLVVDRFEDVTPPALLAAQPGADRTVALYGYVRGAPLKRTSRVHLAGVGDADVAALDVLPDPCPLPSERKRRALDERERLVYAPMSDIGGLLFDRDAVYIDLPDWKVAYSAPGAPSRPEGGEGEALLRALQAPGAKPVDTQLGEAEIQLFAGVHARAEGDEDDEDREESEDSESEDGEGVSDDESDGTQASDDEEDAGARYRAASNPGQSLVRALDGRVRRRAVFGEAAAPLAGSGSDTEASEDEDARMLEDMRGAAREEAERDEEKPSSEDEGLGAAVAWKRFIRERVAELSHGRPVDLQTAVYGERAVAGAKKQPGGAEEEEDGDFFRRRDGGDARGPSSGAAAASASPSSTLDGSALAFTAARFAGLALLAGGDDCSRAFLPPQDVSRWSGGRGSKELLKDRFVTGDWEAGARRAEARPGEGGSDEDEAFGDFEDVEAADPATAAAAKAIRSVAEERSREALDEARRAKKASFDRAYDAAGSGARAVAAEAAREGGGDCGSEEGGESGSESGSDSEPADPDSAGPVQPNMRRKKRGAGEAKPHLRAQQEGEEESFYDAVKRDMAATAERTQAALEAMGREQRLLLQGCSPGEYVRVELARLPCELVAHFDPRRPLLLGGLAQGEEALGFVQVRLKRHRWFPKLLKNRDPLVLSAGWRRFQTLPIFALRDNNARHRLLKYSPEHAHCLASFWGPLLPPGTGVAAVQKLDGQVAGWRIAATGVVLALDSSVDVVKKLKLVGTPKKIARHTAFVEGMFGSQVEASKFEGASVRTVSGIRGTIKKALRAGTQGTRPGAYRATFEDSIAKSDLVFLRAWVKVDVPRFCHPVTDLLAPAPAALARAPKQRKQRGLQGEAKIESAETGSAPTAAGAASEGAFVPSAAFAGAKPGMVFKLGARGLGYYSEASEKGSPVSGGEQAQLAAPSSSDSGPAGWVPMRSTADLRRAEGVGAPRLADSLYREIVRAPRKFKPLKVPEALQAALPFKSKPKVEKAHKRPSLEQRRAVVLESKERKVVSMVQQLSALRNARAVARREQEAKRGKAREKQRVEEERWRKELDRERRKQRYVEQGKAEKRKANLAAKGRGRGGD